jgi:hypothetical protein
LLVFFKHKLGSTVIHGKRIYGYLEAHDPVIVPWGIYTAHLNSLIQASYDKRTLEKLFPGREFPNLSFTYHEIRFLNWEQMCALCKALGITTSRSNTSRRRELRKFFKENC